MAFFSAPQKLFSSPTTITLLASNLFTILLAVTEGWSLALVLWVYWLQSVIIGFFQFWKILSLENFSTEGVKINGHSVEPTQATKFSTAFFFAFHYGFFHFGYFIFLASAPLFSQVAGNAAMQLSLTDVFFILLAAAGFFANHYFSYVYFKNKPKPTPNIGMLMFFPYARIFPMHLFIATGMFLASDTFSLVMFLLLKTCADMAMHFMEHKEQWA